MEKEESDKDVTSKNERDDGDCVFLANSPEETTSTSPKHSTAQSTYTRFLFDPRDLQYQHPHHQHHHSGTGHRRNPSYDSRESTKSVSDFSNASGSPCESPGLQSLSSSTSTTPFPNVNNPFKSEKDFVDFLLTLPPESSPSVKKVEVPRNNNVGCGQNPPQIPPQIGLDHLENLCKLMEQLGELREHNSKLQQRVQYLEEMRRLNEIKQTLKEVQEESIATSPRVVNVHHGDVVFSFDETSEGPKATERTTKRNSDKLRHSKVVRRSKKQKEERSQSMGDDELAHRQRRAFQSSNGHKAKVSKWTKVKEALKWERVQEDNSGGQTTMVSKATVTLKPHNKGDLTTRVDGAKPVKYFQKTDTMREIIVPGKVFEHQQQDPSIPKELFHESESSIDDDDELVDLTDPRNKRCSLGSNVLLNEEYQGDREKAQLKKTKTPITDDEQIKTRKGRSLERKADSVKVAVREKDGGKKLNKGGGAWGKVKTILQTRKDSLKRKHRKSACLDDKCLEQDLYHGEEDTETHRTQHHSSSSSSANFYYGAEDQDESNLPHLTIAIHDKERKSKDFEGFEHGLSTSKLDHECFAGYQRPQSVPASPSQLSSFRYDDLELLEEYFHENKEGEDHSPMSVPSEALRNIEEMQRNMTDDFTKKMQEWEKLKSTCAKLQTSPRLERKSSSSFSGHRFRKTSKDKQSVELLKEERHREKELQWLEKQLQKIEREKQRLTKERQKYLEREMQLSKMKETVMKPLSNKEKKEILVKTSAGEFRFEGISENFTRKLHEWETMRGIGPEVSTLTLLGHQTPSSSTSLDAAHAANQIGAAKLSTNDAQKQTSLVVPPSNGYGTHYARLSERNRSHSESSLANMANVQTSTTSLVMPLDDNDDINYNTDSSSVNALTFSRVNSEPEIEGACAIEVEQMHIEESIPCLEIPIYPVEEPVYSYAPVEVTQLIDSSNNSSSDTERDTSQKNERGQKSVVIHDDGNYMDKYTTHQDEEKPEDNNNGHSQPRGMRSKGEGVSKVRKISAELLQQAKTLEQTIIDKNVTIRQLQWELLQREISNKRFQSDLEKVTSQGFLAESTSPQMAKGKSTHQRSWSAVAYTSKNTKEIDQKCVNNNQSPLESLKITERLEIGSPICLAQKVNELKTELKHLWGSQESNTNSICSVIGSEKDSWTTNQSEFNQAEVTQPVEQRIIVNKEAKDSNFAGNVKAVVIRRVSDTVIPLPQTQTSGSPTIGRVLISPHMIRSKSLSQNSTPTNFRKGATPQVSSQNSKIPDKTCRQRLNTSPVKLNRQKRVETSKEKCHFALRRQNAEDYASSSDTDSESSTGVTFTINLKKNSITKDQPLVESPSFTRSKQSPTTSNAPWRKNGSKDDDEERLSSAPSTPIVRSRSTRKLKPPSVIKSIGSSDQLSLSNLTQVSNSPLAKRRLVCNDNAAPNVRLMIEKFNKKVNEVQCFSSSPNTSRRHQLAGEGVNIGVKKSTSFGDASYAYDSSSSDLASSQNLVYKSVVKSASTGFIENKSCRKQMCSKPPLSPEVTPRKSHGQQSQQPIGIASRIPRCLTAISEQENANRENFQQQSALETPSTNVDTSRALTCGNSPITGIRAFDIKRAKESFLTKVRETVSTTQQQQPNVLPQLSPSSYKLHYQPAHFSFHHKISPREPEKSVANVSNVETVGTSSPKQLRSILKHSCPEVMRSDYQPANYPESYDQLSEDGGDNPAATRRSSCKASTSNDEIVGAGGNVIIKSASAGAVDFVTKYGNKQQISPQESTESNDKHQKSCGLFSFKFRRPKLKQKKAAGESLPAVKALCRQSLLVDIEQSPREDDQPSTASKQERGKSSISCPSSPETHAKQSGATSKSSSDMWQTKTKIFFKSK